MYAVTCCSAVQEFVEVHHCEVRLGALLSAQWVQGAQCSVGGCVTVQYTRTFQSTCKKHAVQLHGLSKCNLDAVHHASGCRHLESSCFGHLVQAAPGQKTLSSDTHARPVPH